MPYDKMDPETRCFTLVGQFLWHWAFMENAINDAIATALDLGYPQRYIVAKNIQFRDKIKILKASIAVGSLIPDDKRREHKRILNKISDYAAKRNIIAHDIFGPDDEADTVIFLRTIANDKFEMPSDHWSTKDFVQSFKEIDAFRVKVIEIEDTLKHANAVKRIAQALMNSDYALAPAETNEELQSQGIFGPLFHPPQDDPDYPPPKSNQAKDPQTPEDL